MSKRVLILGAAGQIAQRLTKLLMKDNDIELVLYGRALSQRLEIKDSSRVKIIDGDFQEKDKLTKAMKDVDVVYLNAMESPVATQTIVNIMNETGVKRLIGVTIAGVEQEVPAPLEDWTLANLPASYVQAEIDSVNIVKNSNLDYTLLRLTWLYDDEDNLNYELVPSGKEFRDAEVSRDAVAHAIEKIITDKNQAQYIKTSFGIGEPGTHYDKPSFY